MLLFMQLISFTMYYCLALLYFMLLLSVTHYTTGYYLFLLLGLAVIISIYIESLSFWSLYTRMY